MWIWLYYGSVKDYLAIAEERYQRINEKKKEREYLQLVPNFRRSTIFSHIAILSCERDKQTKCCLYERMTYWKLLAPFDHGKYLSEQYPLCTCMNANYWVKVEQGYRTRRVWHLIQVTGQISLCFGSASLIGRFLYWWGSWYLPA